MPMDCGFGSTLSMVQQKMSLAVTDGFTAITSEISLLLANVGRRPSRLALTTSHPISTSSSPRRFVNRLMRGAAPLIEKRPGNRSAHDCHLRCAGEQTSATADEGYREAEVVSDCYGYN